MRQRPDGPFVHVSLNAFHDPVGPGRDRFAELEGMTFPSVGKAFKVMNGRSRQPVEAFV